MFPIFIPSSKSFFGISLNDINDSLFRYGLYLIIILGAVFDIVMLYMWINW